MSRFDVVVPCYRYARYLTNCVESVLSQEQVDVRVLIIDDCSPDETPEVAAALVRSDPRVEYRRHTVNQRHIATYNEGLLGWAAGDYCLLLSADDLLLPGALAHSARVLDAHPEVVMTYGKQILFTDEPPAGVPTCTGDSGYRVMTGPAFIEQCCRTGSNPVTTPTAIARTTVQIKVGGYSKELPHSADMEMWLRFALEGSVGIVDACQALKRAHAQNMQHEYVGQNLGDIAQRRETFERFLSADRFGGEERQRFSSLASKALGEEAFWIASRAFDEGQDAICAQLLEAAVQLYPDLVRQKSWQLLHWKRRLGPKAWRMLRPIVDGVRLRGSAPRPPGR